MRCDDGAAEAGGRHTIQDPGIVLCTDESYRPVYEGASLRVIQVSKPLVKGNEPQLAGERNQYFSVSDLFAETSDLILELRSESICTILRIECLWPGIWR